MCGRFTLRTPMDVLIDRFQLEDGVEQPPRYNIAPTQQVVAVRRLEGEHPRQLVLLRWGLIPFWAKDASIGNRMINARAETVAKKPAFRAAFQRRRCLVLTVGYHERTNRPIKKQPFYIRMRDERPFAFAGLWERWRDGGGGDGDEQELVETCTVLTTDANELTRDVHDRMPVILPPGRFDDWLVEGPIGPDAAEAMLVPHPSDGMEAVPVSTRVNSPKHDDPSCLEPIGDQGSLGF